MKHVSNFDSFMNEGKLANIFYKGASLARKIDDLVDKVKYKHKLSGEKQDILDAKMYASAAALALEADSFEKGLEVLKAIPEDLKKRKNEIYDNRSATKAQEIMSTPLNAFFDKWHTEIAKGDNM